ncbi:MAG: RNase adapter RapZ [Hylemonella sp.]|nr:RNase adapter RapZ [Hylemonella sp.]
MKLEIVLITGMSGSGKSVALNALEDTGYFCVDNLPPELLQPFVALERTRQARRIAIAMDARSATSLHQVPALLTQLRQQDIGLKSLFLDASTDTLVRRFSETRRMHPLSLASSDDNRQDRSRALVDAIELERELLGPLREHAHVIDTSLIRAAQLQEQIKSLLSASGPRLTLVFESFSFKRGIPGDADYVFDVRMLPNPHYEPALRALTGKDADVQAFMRAQPEAAHLLDHIAQFLEVWLPALQRNHRSYVTVAVGCTGGQHRSVYFVDQLTQRFAEHWSTLQWHRELNGG